MALLALVLLLIYNMLFFWNRHLPELLPDMMEPIAGFMLEFRGTLTILEILGVVAVFVDLLVRFDKIPAGIRRNSQIILVALVVVAFLFKLFINYLDSAYLEG